MTTILLAEDNDMNRDMLSRRLRRKGYEVLEAVDGEIAVSLARSSSPDLILMDLSMPVLDGWEATRILRNNEDTATIPIIVLTAHAVRAEWDRALESGCDEVVTKPFDFEQLLGTIERWLPRGTDDG